MIYFLEGKFKLPGQSLGACHPGSDNPETTWKTSGHDLEMIWGVPIAASKT
jgi:hypothetical protein